MHTHAHILRGEMGGRGVADTVGPLVFGSKMCFRSNIYCLLHRLQQEIQQNMETFFLSYYQSISILAAPPVIHQIKHLNHLTALIFFKFSFSSVRYF